MDVIMIWLTGMIKPLPKWKKICSLDVPSSYIIWRGQHGRCPAGSRDCLLFRSIWVYPRFLVGPCCSFVFSFACCVCRVGFVLVVLWSLSVHSFFLCLEYPLGISSPYLWTHVHMKEQQKYSNYLNLIENKNATVTNLPCWYQWLVLRLVSTKKRKINISSDDLSWNNSLTWQQEIKLILSDMITGLYRYNIGLPLVPYINIHIDITSGHLWSPIDTYIEITLGYLWSPIDTYRNNIGLPLVPYRYIHIDTTLGYLWSPIDTYI